MHEPPLLRLQRIEVDGLFGIYDHRIDLNLRDRVTLLHGPNGVGKTSVLRMVDALLRNDFACFKRIPLTRFLLGFEDGSTLELQASRGPENHEGSGAGELKLTRADGTSNTDPVDLRPSEAASIAARIEYLQPHHHRRDAWIDVRNGEVLSEFDVLSRFGNNRGEARPRLGSFSLFDHPQLSGPVDSSSSGKSPWLDAFLKNTNAFLIEAQRLVRTESSIRPKTGLSRGSFAFVSSVLECSLDFQRRLGDTMAAYGRHAQTLDQSFPQRLISPTNELAPDELRERMTALDEKTDELRALGILPAMSQAEQPDETPNRPFDAASLDKMDSTQARVMTLYVEDTEHKLRALEDLANRLHLLLNSVNGKFRNKRVRLDREEKSLVAEDLGRHQLPLDSLSSGEQHELVLHYDLLFRAAPNTVVLLDEPELSLHVGWQKKFLSDLTAIVELSGLDAVVATHSPFIVGDRDDLMVGLGD